MAGVNCLKFLKCAKIFCLLNVLHGLHLAIFLLLFSNKCLSLLASPRCLALVLLLSSHIYHLSTSVHLVEWICLPLFEALYSSLCKPSILFFLYSLYWFVLFDYFKSSFINEVNNFFRLCILWLYYFTSVCPALILAWGLLIHQKEEQHLTIFCVN